MIRPAALLLTAVAVIPLGAQSPPRPTPTAAWAPKPTAAAPYPAGVKPWVKIADIKARHQNAQNWRDVVVDDGRLTGEYVAAPPGTKLTRRFHPDTREW